MANELIEITEIFSGGNTSTSNRWSAVNFLNKVCFANNTVKPQYWIGTGTTIDIPGLPISGGYDGISSFQGHLMLWKGRTLKWSDVNDFSCWIPIAETSATLRMEVLEDFTQPSPGVTTDWIYVLEAPENLVVDGFVRIDADPQYNFYTVKEISPFVIDSTSIATTIGVNQFIAPAAAEKIFLTTFPNVADGALATFQYSGAKLLETSKSALNTYWTTLATQFIAPAIGGFGVLEITDTPSVANVGDYISIGSQEIQGLDIYGVAAIDVENKRITVLRTGIGTATNTAHAAGVGIVMQYWVELINFGTVTAVSAAGTPVSELYAIKVSLEELTGSTPDGDTMAAGSIFDTMEANEAGELENTGGKINGPIWQVIDMGEYAYIFKERSIQSIQYSGRPSIFFIRSEQSDEGLLGKYTWVSLGQERIFFLGHKELYEYTGGSALKPVAIEYSKQLLQEINLNRVDEAWMYHNEVEHEVWLCYPIGVECLKILIYNYVDNSCTIDDYTAEIGGLTAAGAWDWTQDIRWSDVPGSWDDQTLDWDEFVGEGKERLTILGVKEGYAGNLEDQPGLLIHGRVYNRGGLAYQCTANTVSFEADDPAVWKYIDTVQISLYIKVILENGPYRLKVRVGTQANFDDTIYWTDTDYIEASGNGNMTTKINLHASGRFLYLNFFSDQLNIEWRVTSFTLMGRVGGTY